MKRGLKIEKEYVEAMSKGDSKAFDLLYLHYQPRLVAFFIGFIQDEEIARDLAQDVFFNLWMNREKLSNVASFSAYLFQSGRNALYNYYDHTLVCEKYDTTRLFQPLTVNNVEEEILIKELQAVIDLCVDRMPPQRRQVFRMSRVDGLSNDEIASKLQISKRTVEKHLSDALKELRKVLRLAIMVFVSINFL